MNQLDLSNPEHRIFGKMLRMQAERAGNTAFLVTENERFSFAEAEAITNALAGGLIACGLEKGDRVALYMGNRSEVVLFALAINKIGAIWTPINTDYKGEWLRDTLTRSRCKVLLTDAEYEQRIVDMQQKLSVEHTVLIADGNKPRLQNCSLYEQLLDHPPIAADYTDMNYGDTCAILWTSGTTGISKGVMQSYNSWVRAIVDGSSLMFDSRQGDVIYCVLPLFNAAAWITSIFRALIEGIPCVIEPRFSVSNFWDRIKQFDATQTFLIGAMGVFVLNAPKRPDDANNPLRAAQIVPLSPELWPVFEERFDVRLVRTGLGQSECLMVTTQSEDRDDVPVYALGFPPADIDVGLFDDDGNPVAAGEGGEICVRPLAPHVLFNGYFDSPEATAEAFRGEWFLTGDIGRQDPENGAYYYVDRKKDTLRFAGRNISTLEVESVVRGHPDVDDVAAFGIPSAQVASEHELKLNIVLAENASTSYEQLCEFVNDNAPHFFVPRYIEFVDSLPYTPTNKVRKFKLREAGLSEQTWDIKLSSYKVKR
ncbi:MAG: AMP-binding protein [Pseudomonadales bacterium]